MSLARYVGAFVQDYRQVRVRINNWPEHLFYFSNVLDGPVSREQRIRSVSTSFL